MKKHVKILPLFLSIVIFMSCILNSFIIVHADSAWDKFDRWATKTGLKIIDIVFFGAAQIGAIADKHDFELFLSNQDAFLELWNRDSACPVIVNDDTNDITLTKEFMAQLKALLDEYAKTEQTKEENGGFYLLPTTKFDEVPASYFINSQQFRTFRNIVIEKGVLAVLTQYRGLPMRFVDPFSDPDHPILLVGDVSDMNLLQKYSWYPVYSSFFCAYDWKNEGFRTQTFPESDQIYTSVSDGIDYKYTNVNDEYRSNAMINFDVENHGNISEQAWILYSTTGERVRVFVSQNAAKNYSVGSRKIYFSENYYNYVPEDLTVSIDDLQKSVDDLQKIIDELLKKISDQTSEKEIEELLRQILEELRKNPGGGGSGSGGGDVTVSVDLKETNNWLSKIYDKVSQIFDQMQPDGSGGYDDSIIRSFLTRIQTSLDKIHDSITDLKQTLVKYLKTITSDLDDIKDQLEDMSEEEFNDKTDSFLDDATGSFSEIGELAKTKFPFSIPNDMKNFLAVLAQTSPEAAGLYSDESSGISLYSGEHGGGGSSRPGSDGFIYVEHGGHGGGGVSREPAEVVNGAPVFALPIVIERYGIEEYVIIDMAPFEPISKLSRSLFTMMFMLCLFNLTFKVMGLWGDLVND